MSAKIGKKSRIFASDMFFMNKRRGTRMLLIVVGMLLSIIMPAQDLPVLSADKAVRTGVLPNGTSYYIVANPTKKGIADFALVQKTGTANISDSASFRTVSAARDALTALPRSGGVSVQKFFAAHGVTPGKEGFVKVSEDFTEYRFSNVLLARPEVLDSALLVILDMVDRVSITEDPFVRKWYSPSDQAVVVAGDVDAASVADKLKMISYMTPSLPSSPRKEYKWEERGASYSSVPSAGKGLASFTAVWNSARTPREYMNTVQPVIYDLFVTELGMVAEDYIADGLRSRNIPYASISCGHKTSVQSSGDEVFTVSVSVAEKDFPLAVRTVGEVMGRIDAGKTDVNDILRMKRICMDSVREQAFRSVFSNSEYIDRCVTAFLYNGSLATYRTKVDFLSGRVLADSTELRLFNNIASALLEPEMNLSVSYSHSMPVDSVRTILTDAWDSSVNSSDFQTGYTRSDIPVFEYDGPRVKVKSERVDHMSGGLEWTFSNGFKVVYRKMPTDGRLYYTLALNSGFSSVEGLEKGEGGYVSDYFLLSRIGGIPAGDFIATLEAAGMSLDVHVGLNATMISGSADDDDVDFMMKALHASIYGRKMDPASVRYYESCEPLRNVMRKGTSAEMVARINEIMCPDYEYVSYKMKENLSPELAVKADKFFEELSMKMNDGVLILLGDVDAAVMKKAIQPYVGGFVTKDRAFRRPMVRYVPASGWSTYTVTGDRNSVDIALSMPLALTVDNYMAAEIAIMVLKNMISEALTDTGMYPSMSHELKIYPNERVNFHIALNEVSENGFSSDTENSGPIEALSIVRSVLSGVAGSEIEISAADVEMFKTQLKERMKTDMMEPFYWLNVISRRHLAGKDFTSGYESRINTVNADKVKEVLAGLSDGTRVEYIISKR